jgi:hypothetical protein
MTTRTMKCALVIGLAGAFALATTASFAASKKYPKDSYEAWGAKEGMAPPVPGFALAGYKPGLCWKVMKGGGTTEFGKYVPCSEWKSKGE